MAKIDYFRLIHKHIDPENSFYKIYLPHVTLVTNKALAIGRKVGLSAEQLTFIEEAGMLHDIGIIKIKSDLYENSSQLSYLCHGVEGSAILTAEGLPNHALVAERHTGVGITLAEINQHHLPLPQRDLTPQSIEEKIICYADLFFSKRIESLWEEESVESIRAELAVFGSDKVAIFDEWHQQFGK